MADQTQRYRTSPHQVHTVLDRYMLADGMDIVFDLERSQGCRLYDSKADREYLDLFSFFASQPIGFNHPKMMAEDFQAKLASAATCKPTNSDIYSQAFADFVQTFAEETIPETHRSRLFFVEGGALAVENAMKAAFDWKYLKNKAAGKTDSEDLQILHFESAFHGRTGYTLSVTNTQDPRKYQYFPLFDWPRVTPPAITFPLDDEKNLAAVEAAEAHSLAQIRAAFEERQDLIAAILIETIQGEGGDNHFRTEYLQALQDIAKENDALLIFDEVQCGMGLTGTWWAFEAHNVVPDIFSFGKKSQVCGIAAGPRLDEVNSVFQVSSRLNSTWGGNLVDMVRSEQYIKIIVEEKLLDNVNDVAALVLELLDSVEKSTGAISNVRGQGLMIAFDLVDEATRDQLAAQLQEAGVIILACGERSLRFRPVLDIDEDSAREAVAAISKGLSEFSKDV